MRTIWLIFSVLFLLVIIHSTNSWVIPDQLTENESILDEKDAINDESNSFGRLPLLRKKSLFVSPRRSEPAESYFDWASRSQRPMEYFRGKRFWLFTKKDDSGHQIELHSNVHGPSNSLSQGIWRSGIVGRRR